MNSFNLILRRLFSNHEETLGVLYHNYDKNYEKHLCFILEDEYRTKKVYGETRIPAGTYPLKLRSEGTLHNKMLLRFPRIHRGMIHIDNVPDFKFILIHPGNTDDDTAGCLLPGEQPSRYYEENKLERWKVIESSQAYLRIYPIIAENILNNQDSSFITIIDDYSKPVDV